MTWPMFWLAQDGSRLPGTLPELRTLPSRLGLSGFLSPRNRKGADLEARGHPKGRSNSGRRLSLNRDQPAAGSRPIGVAAVTCRVDRDGSRSKEVAMRPIRTIAPLALGLAALAVAGCQSRSDQPTTTVPTQVERAAPATTAPALQAPLPTTAPTPKPDPSPETVVGLWPVKSLAQARELQDGADAGHQPWVLSPELVSTAYAEAELDLFAPYAQRVGPAAYQVRSHHGEWEATLYLAQPIRHNNGIWVVTRIGDPVS
jgi:hypothetical protein